MNTCVLCDRPLPQKRWWHRLWMQEPWCPEPDLECDRLREIRQDYQQTPR